MPKPEPDGPDFDAGALSSEQRALVDAATVPTFLAGPDAEGAPILYANPAYLRLTGYAADEIAGRPARFLAAERGERGQAAAEGPDADFLAARRDGSTFWAVLGLVPVAGTSLLLGQVLDVSRRHDAEGALALARQREALGLLTNSVAHEFNNFLQILIGYIDGLRRRLGDSPDPFIQRAMVRSGDATERAAALTRQLLAFSRRISPDVRPVDLDAVVAEIADRLRSTLPAGLRLDVTGTPGLAHAVSNPTQIELALRYLVANAAEAMPDGGTLSVATFALALSEHAIRYPGEASVGIRIRDTGTGMSQEMLARALAPFATSHEAGRGAGLAIVQGLMKRQNGTIALESRPGEGTEVRLVFPAIPVKDAG